MYTHIYVLCYIWSGWYYFLPSFLANRSFRYIFLLRNRLNLYVTSLRITSQWRQGNVPYFEKLQHLELFIQFCSSTVQPSWISLGTVPQGTGGHLWAGRKGRQYVVCPTCICLKYVPTQHWQEAGCAAQTQTAHCVWGSLPVQPAVVEDHNLSQYINSEPWGMASIW